MGSKAATLLDATTAMAQSAPFRAVVPQSCPATFQSSDLLAGVETAVVQYYSPIADDWVNLVLGGVTQQLDANNNMVTVYGPGLYRVNKGTTTAAIGISVSYGETV